MHTTRFTLPFVALIIMVLSLTSCMQERDIVNVYSGRHYQVDEDLFRAFTHQTGIRINLIKADSDQLINRLELEGRHSPADILITADAGRMIQAKNKDLLQPIQSDFLQELIPSYLRDSEMHWIGFTKRARALVYDPNKTNVDYLSTYEALSSEYFANKVLVRSSQNHYNQTLMASLVAALGNDKAQEWASGVVRNMAQNPRGNDRDQVKAIAAGIGEVAIVNTYYMGLLLNSTNSEERKIAKKMRIFFPNQEGRGTHINISGAAITAHSPNKENAIRLLEFLLQKDAQNAFAEKNYEYPVNPKVQYTPLLESWGSFKADTLPLDHLGDYLHDAMIIFNHAAWN